MKNKFKNVGLLAFLGCAFLACGDDPFNEEENTSKKISVQFETAATEIAENAGEETLLLKLNRPAFFDAVLTLKSDDSFDGVLNTAPAAQSGLVQIQIRKGDTSAALKIIPIDNEEADVSKTITLRLHNLPLQFIEGPNKTVTLTVKDDDTMDPGVESIANFISQEVTLEETHATGIEYQIHLSEAVARESHIRITVSSEKGIYGAHYVTEPETDNSVLTLPVTVGSRVVAFKVKPVANDGITGELKIKLTISETSGSVRKGNNLEQTLTIKDDELAGKPMGYEVTAGNTIVKRFYEYNAEGRIAKANWENYTPYRTSGVDTYHYDANGRLMKVNKHAFKDMIYHWEGERIVRSDEVVDGIVRDYHEYYYDEYDNISGVVSYHLQNNGSFVKGFFTVYLYFPDGNVYKSLTYQDTENPEEPYLVSTKTYDGYIDQPNYFPMVNILPNKKAQTKLPTTYRVEEGQLDATYQMVYEYRPDGLPAKRIATSTGDMQTAVYHYY